MKNIKLKMFLMLALVLLHIPVYCENYSYDFSGVTNAISGYGSSVSSAISGYGSNVANAVTESNKTVVAAIEDLKGKTMDALHGTANNSIVNTLNKIFVADTGAGTSSNQSVIDLKIDGYVKSFYSLYATDQNFINSTVEINNQTEINYTSDNNVDNSASSNASRGDLLSIERKMKRGVKRSMKKEIYYDTQKTLLDKIKDFAALLLIPAESGDNNINASRFNETINSTFQGGSPFGSLDDSINVDTNNTSSASQDVMDVSVLIGPDSYSKEEGNKVNNAKMFINQLIQATPAPRTFSFPQAIDSTGNMTLYLPYPSTGVTPATPYTKVSGISTNQPSNCRGAQCLSAYDKIINYLSQNSLYQEYKAKVRSKIALRTLYLDAIMRVFQNRYKEKQVDLSLVEKERYMASVGLTKTYYNNLKDKSVADINLETLHTLNKIVYFLYKLHQDNERNQLVTSVAQMQLQQLDPQDEKKYLKPIGALIENGCWADDYKKEPAPNGANETSRESACRSTN